MEEQSQPGDYRGDDSRKKKTKKTQIGWVEIVDLLT